MNKILEIIDLRLSISDEEILKGVSLTLGIGETLGIVGESGSGKSVTAKAIVGLNPQHTTRIQSGRINYMGKDLLTLDEGQLRAYRGGEIAMIFQENGSSLNPTMRVGKQIEEALPHPHSHKTKKRVLELLDLVGIADPEKRYAAYPHELSGGMRQRVMIAIALAAEPKILIADEPTTALDVTIQAQILELLKSLQQQMRMGIIYITHDLNLAAEFCDRIVVMHEGMIVENAKTETLFASPSHPYTKKLLNSIQFAEHTPKQIQSKEPLIELKNLVYTYQTKKGPLLALKNLTLDIFPGETLGMVGESGSGKTTLGKLLLQMIQPISGTITHALSRKEIQMVYQDPYSSLNPRMTVLEIIEEPLVIHTSLTKAKRFDHILHLLSLVGLDPPFASRYPHELSGGQRQRIVIARALSLNPRFLILDEPIASLDASIQAQIIQLLKELQSELNLTYFFISHDLNAVKHLSDRVAVLYAGEIVELTTSEEIYSNPLHPYTQALLSSIPGNHTPKKLLLKGEVPSPFIPIVGCPFASRCGNVMPICKENTPLPTFPETNHLVACHLSRIASATT